MWCRWPHRLFCPTTPVKTTQATLGKRICCGQWCSIWRWTRGRKMVYINIPCITTNRAHLVHWLLYSLSGRKGATICLCYQDPGCFWSKLLIGPLYTDNCNRSFQLAYFYTIICGSLLSSWDLFFSHCRLGWFPVAGYGLWCGEMP